MRENTIKKMETSLADVVKYSLEINGEKYVMNDLIGSQKLNCLGMEKLFACVEGVILNFTVQVFVTLVIGRLHSFSKYFQA